MYSLIHVLHHKVLKSGEDDGEDQRPNENNGASPIGQKLIVQISVSTPLIEAR